VGEVEEPLARGGTGQVAPVPGPGELQHEGAGRQFDQAKPELVQELLAYHTMLPCRGQLSPGRNKQRFEASDQSLLPVTGNWS